MLTRKVLVASTAAFAALAAFIGASYATTRAADLPASLPAAALSKTTLPPETRAAIADLLTPETVEQFGLTEDSYSNVRELAVTEAGPVYVLPGRRGVCVALLPAVTCGNPQGAGRAVATLVPNEQGTFAVGAGVLARGIGRVTFARANGKTTAPTLIPGGFLVTAEHGIRPGERFQMSLR